jgi:predicted AAA+ superfamily ATPase
VLIPARTCVNQYSKGASDPIGAFLVEECEYDPEYYELRDALYDAYKDYAKSLNTSVEGNRVFFDRVRSVPGVSVDRKKRVEGKAERVVMGLRLRNNSG